MCMNTEAHERAVAQRAEEGGTHGEQRTHSRVFGMREDRRIDADGPVPAKPIGQTSANPIGNDDDDIFDIGDEGDLHQELYYDKVAMSEFLEGSESSPYHTISIPNDHATSMPNAKKRKNTESVHTPVCPLHETHALADEILTSLVYVRRLTPAMTSTSPPHLVSSTTLIGHIILRQTPRTRKTHRQSRPRYVYSMRYAPWQTTDSQASCVCRFPTSRISMGCMG